MAYAKENWSLSVESKPKLRTYRLFKTDLVPEPYVTCFMNRYQRSTFAKFRCGILPIQLELGRFRGQKVDERICPICNNAVETEIHFMLDCPSYDSGSFLQDMNINANQNPTEILKTCMAQFQKPTSKFIGDLWRQRQKLLFDM